MKEKKVQTGMKKTWESTRMQKSISPFCICPYNLRGFSKNDHKLQMEKLKFATKLQYIVGMLDTHLNHDEIDIMVKHKDNDVIIRIN